MFVFNQEQTCYLVLSWRDWSDLHRASSAIDRLANRYRKFIWIYKTHLVSVQFYLLYLNSTTVLLTILSVSELAVFILYFVLGKYENKTKIKNRWCYFLYALKWVSVIVCLIYSTPFTQFHFLCIYVHTHARTHAHLYKRANLKM